MGRNKKARKGETEEYARVVVLRREIGEAIARLRSRNTLDRGGGTALKRESATSSDRKHQSESKQDGRYVGHVTRRRACGRYRYRRQNHLENDGPQKNK